MRILVASPYPQGVSAMTLLRLEGPLEFAGLEYEWWALGFDLEAAVRRADAILIQREWPKLWSDYRALRACARQAGKPILYETDDLLWSLSADHPGRLSRELEEALIPMLLACGEADAVLTTTEPLANELRKVNGRVHVLPNFLHDGVWPMQPPADAHDGPVTIGYAASETHLPDLTAIAPALRRVLLSRPGAVRLKLFGVGLPEELAGLPGVERMPLIGYGYRRYADLLRSAGLDIGLAPLIDNGFNRCKSAVKFFEYAAGGTATVASRVIPYDGVMEDRRTGLLADSVEEWEAALHALVDSPALRRSMVEAAQAEISARWLLSKNANRWAAVLGGIVLSGGGPASRWDGTVDGAVLEDAWDQTFRVLDERRNKLYWLEGHIGEQTKAIFALEDLTRRQEKMIAESEARAMRQSAALEQILQSNTWKLTAPLRSVTGGIRRLLAKIRGSHTI